MSVREHLESLIEAWRDGDAVRAVAHFAPDAVYREAGGHPIAGRDAIFAHFTRFFRDGPRWRFEVDLVLVDGERAALGYRFATEGRGLAWSERAGCALVRLSGGAIAEWREYEG